ncbi:MAG: DinB family protein [Planctomycetia bacterium]|nr:DinB family protein [Planctomycetia bacterium]
MDTRQAIASSLTNADFLVQTYLADLKPEELLARSLPGTNHIAWQLGHLISAECFLVGKALPGKGPTVPAGFGEKHKKQTAASDNPADFLTKEEYLRMAKEVRSGTLRLVDELPAEEFDRAVEVPPPVVKTVGQTFLFVGAHWLMHAGQWAIIRRKLGRPPLF